MSSVIFQTYTFNDVDIYDESQLNTFLTSFLPYTIKFYSLTYNSTTNILIIKTKEPTFLSTTQTTIEDILNTYPNPEIFIPTETEPNPTVISESVYGYFASSTSIDGDFTVSSDISLTRNMYYKNLTVNENRNLNANGWRIVVTNILTLNGTISNNGTNAVLNVAGTGSSPVFTTYLGPGTNGGSGNTSTSNGNAGVTVSYQCSGGRGGSGGTGGSNPGGAAGIFNTILQINGGAIALSTLPIGFLGRMISSDYYIVGGTGGGGGGSHKGSSAVIKSGAGGGAGGLIVIAAKKIIGNGTISAKGGNGSSASYTGSTAPTGLGGGGGGGGGCIILISQFVLPETITVTVSGGTAGTGIGSQGYNGVAGSAGNVYIIQV